MEFRNVTLASLECRVLRGKSQPQTVVVLNHGFGAPGDDLVPLADELLELNPSLAEKVAFVFPEAPISLEEYGGGARAWWRLDMARLQAMMNARGPALETRRNEIPEGLPEARKKWMAMLDAISIQWNVPRSRFVLGGFSQGAMLATDVALRLEEAPAALVVLSGTLIQQADWRARAPSRRGLKVLMSHGRQDAILPFSEAEALKALFEEAGLSVEFLPFDGPHTIARPALARLGTLLDAL